MFIQLQRRFGKDFPNFAPCGFYKQFVHDFQSIEIHDGTRYAIGTGSTQRLFAPLRYALLDQGLIFLNANLLRAVVYITSIFGLYMATSMFVPAMTDLYYGIMTGSFSPLPVSCAGDLRWPARSQPVDRCRPSTSASASCWSICCVGGLLSRRRRTALSIGTGADIRSGPVRIRIGNHHNGRYSHLRSRPCPQGLLIWRSLLCWLGGISVSWRLVSSSCRCCASAA